jgi:hypothetical protein
MVYVEPDETPEGRVRLAAGLADKLGATLIGLSAPQEHGFGEHCLGMAVIFSSCRTNKLPLAHQR